MKIDLSALIAFLIEAFFSRSSKPAPVPNVPAAPSQTPTAPVPVPRATMGVTSWVEEFWHDWFRGVVDETSDWCPGGTPKFNAIMEGAEKAPPGVRVRFMAEELPAGSGDQGAYVIEHVFDLNGTVYVVKSDSPEDVQPFGALGHVVRGPRWRNGKGWDVTIQFREWNDEPKLLKYFVRSTEDSSLASAPASFTIAKG